MRKSIYYAVLLLIATALHLSAQHKDFRDLRQFRNQRSPAAIPFETKISAQQSNPLAAGIIYGESVAPPGSNNDMPAIWGRNLVDDYWGVGVRGEGGYIGVEGYALGLGNELLPVDGFCTGKRFEFVDEEFFSTGICTIFIAKAKRRSVRN